MKSRPIASAIILLFFCSLGLAQSQQDALDVLNKVAETYRSTKTLQAEADVQTEMNGQGVEQKVAAHMFLTVAAPGKFRMETKTGPAKILMIADGRTLWMYFPELNKYSKMPVGHDSGADALSSAGLSTLGSLPDFSKVAEGVREARMLPSETLQFDGVPIDCYVISVLQDLRPAAPGSDKAETAGVQPSNETLWVDKSRLLILRLKSNVQVTSTRSTVFFETNSTVTFTKLALDEPLADDAFEFNPPQGASELDFTQFMPQQSVPQ